MTPPPTSALDKPSYGEARVLGKEKYLFIAITPESTPARNGSTY